MSAALGILETALGHTFRDRELLARALTHKSHVYENLPTTPSTATMNNSNSWATRSWDSWSAITWFAVIPRFPKGAFLS